MKANLSMGLKIGYSAGIMGESLIFNTSAVYFLVFLTSAVGIEPGIAGTICTTLLIWSAFTDLIAGRISDGSKNSKGKRRPIMAKALIPLSVFSMLMYSNVDFIPEGGKVIYFFIVGAMLWLCFSLVDIPYISLGYELTDDYDERNSVRGISNIINHVGFLFVNAILIQLIYLFSNGEGFTSSSAWVKVSLIIGILVFVSYLISIISTKGKEKNLNIEKILSVEQSENPSYVTVLKETILEKSFRNVLIYTILGYGGLMVNTTALVYFQIYVVGLSANQMSFMGVFYCAVVMIFSVAISKLGEKIEKKNLVIGSAVIAGAGMITCFFLLGNAPVVGMYIMQACLAAGSAGFFVIIYSMVYDVCSVDLFKCKKDRSSTIVSIFYFVIKLVGAGAAFICGWSLDFGGFDATAITQTTEAISMLSIVALLVPTGLYIIGALVVTRYPINRKNFTEIIESLEKRKKEEDVSGESLMEK